MNSKQFIENHKVVHSLNRLKELKEEEPNHFIVSDIIDEEGNQYVDLVQEGGGILGIALIGYIYVLEEMGIRFLNLAGTSAGSISTVLLASIGKPHEKKSEKLINILANQDFSQFVDGDNDSKKLIKTITKDSGILKKVKLLFHGIQVLDNLKNDLGLNSGNYFHNWLTEILRKQKVETTKDLLDKINETPPLKIRPEINRNYNFEGNKIAIIDSDITTETKVIFPAMGELYYDNILEVNPADFVRASMSIPIFFSPFKIKSLPKGPIQLLKWNTIARYKGEIPEEVLFVDGGIMSNFPIDVFHSGEETPIKPTFGIKLGLSRNKSKEIDGLINFLYSSFNSARQIRDFEFILNNPDFEQLVGIIDIDEDKFDWIDFDLPDELKIELFYLGVKEACRFLERFSWEKYKKIRKDSIAKKVINIWKSSAQINKIQTIAEEQLAYDFIRNSLGAAPQNEEDKERENALVIAEEHIKSRKLLDFLCPALKSISDDLGEVAKIIGSAMIPLAYVPGTSIPLTPLIIGSIAVIIFKSGISSICKERENGQ